MTEPQPLSEWTADRIRRGCDAARFFWMQRDAVPKKLTLSLIIDLIAVVLIFVDIVCSLFSVYGDTTYWIVLVASWLLMFVSYCFYRAYKKDYPDQSERRDPW